MVEGIVGRDAAAGLPQAVALRGMVNRRLVKQTVMTSVYGVTGMGAKDQIAARLIERGWANNRQLQKVAAYAAKVCFHTRAAAAP